MMDIVQRQGTNVNLGNFRELILLDNNFKESILSSKRSSNYLSKTTQNDLLVCIKEYIQHEIVKEIKNQPEGPFYSLSADEVTNVSNWEQLGVTGRYTKDCCLVEKPYMSLRVWFYKKTF